LVDEEEVVSIDNWILGEDEANLGLVLVRSYVVDHSKILNKMVQCSQLVNDLGELKRNNHSFHAAASSLFYHCNRSQPVDHCQTKVGDYCVDLVAYMRTDLRLLGEVEAANDKLPYSMMLHFLIVGC